MADPALTGIIRRLRAGAMGRPASGRIMESVDLVPAASKSEAYTVILHYVPSFVRTIEVAIHYRPTSAD